MREDREPFAWTFARATTTNLTAERIKINCKNPIALIILLINGATAVVVAGDDVLVWGEAKIWDVVQAEFGRKLISEFTPRRVGAARVIFKISL